MVYYITQFLENKLGGDTAKNLLVQNPESPGIRYLSKEALAEINKNPDYFSGGVINVNCNELLTPYCNELLTPLTILRM